MVVPVTGAVWAGQNGDRVTLTAALKPHTEYLLAPAGPILDDADAASAGTANAIDLNAETNRRRFALSDRLTITLGASGYENLTIPVHDTAMVGPGLNTWSHDSVWLVPVENSTPRVNTGFVRFEWQNAFRQATVVTNAGQILEAAFLLHPELGDSQTVEIRRVLQRWSDPASGGDWNQNATGAPTWRDSAHPNRRWTTAGAGRLGGTGAQATDYNGVNDLASRVDATLRMQSINEPAEFGGALVTDAFRFWFGNPAVDYGYALRLAAAASQGTKFERWEAGLKNEGPVLRLTYLLPGATPRVAAKRIGQGLQIEWPAEPGEYVLQAADSVPGAWTNVATTPNVQAGSKRLEVPPVEARQFFRLMKP